MRKSNTGSLNENPNQKYIYLAATVLVLAFAYLISRFYLRWRSRIPNLQGYKFNREKVVGKGGFGTVIKCTYRHSGKNENGLCALKLLNPRRDQDLKKEWRHEAGRLAQLRSHPNVVGFIGADVCERNGNILFRIATEFVPKGALSQHLSNGWFSNKPWTFKLKVARGICEGVRFIHDQGIIHMDLKSDNILLGNGNTPKIADFGLARYRPRSFITRDYRGPIGGDIRYISPECCVTNEDAEFADARANGNLELFCRVLEQLVSDRITRASDMFSLGIVFWEIASGRLTSARTKTQIEAGTITGNTRSNRVRFFRPPILGCVQFDPNDRLDIAGASRLFSDKDGEARDLDSSCAIQ